MSEIEKEVNDVPTNDETPKKVYKRNWSFTPARKEAFERCKKARQEALKNFDKNKKIKAVLKREQKLKKKKEELGIVEEPKEVMINFPETDPIDYSSQEEKAKPKTRKQKTKVKIEDDESIDDDDYEFEYVIKRVSTQAPKPQKYEPPPPQEDTISKEERTFHFI